MKHTISVLVRNQFGVLARVAGLFSGRGYNIDSLSVAETQDPTLSRMTIVSHGDEAILEQIMKQLNKLIDVVKVTDFHDHDKGCVMRELALIKVHTTPQTRAEIMQIVNIFRAKVVDISPKTMMVEATGPEAKLEALVEMLRPFGIKDMVQSGRVALARK